MTAIIRKLYKNFCTFSLFRVKKLKSQKVQYCRVPCITKGAERGKLQKRQKRNEEKNHIDYIIRRGRHSHPLFCSDLYLGRGNYISVITYSYTLVAQGIVLIALWGLLPS